MIKVLADDEKIIIIRLSQQNNTIHNHFSKL